MNALRQRFGRLVAAHRRRKGWTQQQLAESTGISHDMINRIERGVVAARFPNIVKLAETLNVDPSELFTPDTQPVRDKRPALLNVVARLSALSDEDLEWTDQLLDAALKPRLKASKAARGSSLTIKLGPPGDK